MEWITAIQRSIDYMEEHLLEDVDYNRIAEAVYISSFHFHSAFSMLMGMTAKEYIRNRRLSMAGQELTLAETKVIDIAYKYGYDTPESFCKAFTRFHGISPSQAKQPGAKLTLFSPMKIKIIVEGGKVMDYRIENREAFCVLARVRAFRNDRIHEEGNHEIPDFWTECGQTGVFEVLNEHRCSQGHYGICSPVSKEEDCFDYGIGVICDRNVHAPEGYTILPVEEGLWAVFSCFGRDESCMDNVWEKIYKEFLPQSGYEIRDYADFEYYPADGGELFCEIWAPVKKKI